MPFQGFSIQKNAYYRKENHTYQEKQTEIQSSTDETNKNTSEQIEWVYNKDYKKQNILNLTAQEQNVLWLLNRDNTRILKLLHYLFGFKILFSRAFLLCLFFFYKSLLILLACANLTR